MPNQRGVLTRHGPDLLGQYNLTNLTHSKKQTKRNDIALRNKIKQAQENLEIKITI